MLIDRWLLLSVDGGRCYLPAPRPITEGEFADDTLKVVGQEARPLHTAVARLVDGLGGSISEFDRYLEMSHIIVRDY